MGEVHETSSFYDVIAIFPAQIIQGFIQALLFFTAQERRTGCGAGVPGCRRLIIEQVKLDRLCL